MKNRLKLGVSALFLSASISLSAQSGKIYSDWQGLEESPKLIDVSYRILDCTEGGDTEVHLHVFNENTTDQSISFTLNLKDSVGNVASIDVSDVQMKMAEMRSAECGSTENSDLKFAFPTGLNKETTTITITYKD